jgi:hypothetical protein
MNKHTRTTPPATHQGDFHRWTAEQGRFLRQKRLELVDWENVAEEIETLGRTERREIENRLAIAILHLLKWQFQPERRKGGWEASIRVQRRELKQLLAENPSLSALPAQSLQHCYDRARIEAEHETGLAYETFPQTCPFTADQVLDDGFLPA